MAKAHVDPDELKRFARDLNRFNNDLEGLMGGLHLKLMNLEKTWQDQEQRKFSAEFELTMKTLARFLDVSRQHVAFLVKKSRHIEEYLGQ